MAKVLGVEWAKWVPPLLKPAPPHTPFFFFFLNPSHLVPTSSPAKNTTHGCQLICTYTTNTCFGF
ncbi:hypothetical protein HanXRQr2_Chr07g0283841 [Helianthus annuus]|uniref:Uncharacterized protein n=1 Tax=Helianthus annuus TaxID=4232 RepID=A0A9K3NEL8_HELAN|nr:hypothetical protein HanXRQr2_Chr07g0283841 [Helianthus annuus]KAJ0555760.1 hypothetical protein HanIR_Chr07g0305811 [Helianthus annuus]KAJ0903841.1 hypothetical protein HanPSC8_Chr07g0274691 [Helianthus annuus]